MNELSGSNSRPGAAPAHLNWQWNTHTTHPVIAPGQLHGALDNQRAGAAHVMDMGDHYRMYYWATGDKGNVILMAEAPVDQPNAWRPRCGVLLAPQPDVPLNHHGPSFPHVFKITETRWHMIFCAWGEKLPTGRLANTTGLAISDDAGLSWRYHDHHPILPLDQPCDHSATGSVWVTRDNNEFRMYYTAIGDWFTRPADVKAGHGDSLPTIGIGYAVSRDGICWHKPLKELMIVPRFYDTQPYEYIVSKPCVIRDTDTQGNDAGWRMFVSTFGHAYRTHSLVSSDGLSWSHVPSTPDGDIGVGAPGSFDDHQRSYACVVKHKNEYRMWYTGNRFGLNGMGYCTAEVKG